MNLDTMRNFPNQRIDGDATECVGLTVTDICANIDRQLYDPDYSYAATLRLMNQAPNTNGLDPYEGMLEAVSYGLLPMTAADFTANVVGELYVANYNNYALEDRQLALYHTRNSVQSLYSFDAIVDWMNKVETGVSLALRWHMSFASPNPDGTLPSPSGPFTYHNVAVYDYDPIKGLMVKPWLGSDFAESGYCWITRNVFNLIFEQAAAFDDTKSRWFSLATILVTHPSNISTLLPQLIKLR